MESQERHVTSVAVRWSIHDEQGQMERADRTTNDCSDGESIVELEPETDSVLLSWGGEASSRMDMHLDTHFYRGGPLDSSGDITDFTNRIFLNPSEPERTTKKIVGNCLYFVATAEELHGKWVRHDVFACRWNARRTWLAQFEEAGVYPKIVDIPFSPSDQLWESEVRAEVYYDGYRSDDSSVKHGGWIGELSDSGSESGHSSDSLDNGVGILGEVDESDSSFFEGKRFGYYLSYCIEEHNYVEKGDNNQYLIQDNLLFVNGGDGIAGTWLSRRMYGCSWGKKQSWLGCFHNVRTDAIYVDVYILNVPFAPTDETFKEKVERYFRNFLPKCLCKECAMDDVVSSPQRLP